MMTFNFQFNINQKKYIFITIVYLFWQLFFLYRTKGDLTDNMTAGQVGVGTLSEHGVSPS